MRSEVSLKSVWVEKTLVIVLETSSQDGGIGRNPSLPHTTRRRITTNLKSINNQKHQKIKLHGTLTTKDIKKKTLKGLI